MALILLKKSNSSDEAEHLIYDEDDDESERVVGLPTPTNMPSMFGDESGGGYVVVDGRDEDYYHWEKSLRGGFFLIKSLFRAPAFKQRGKVYEGNPGETHGDLWARHSETSTPIDTMRSESGFVSHKGKFYNRLQATKIANRREKLVGSGNKLRALHTITPGAVASPPKIKASVKKRILAMSTERA